MATIKDVASHAGVSVATVSRVINNKGYLSDAVKEKVRAAMAALDYQPNELARSLHSQRSRILGLIVPAVSHPFFGDVAQRIEQCAYELGYKLLLCNSLQNQHKEREYIDMLKRSQVDGIIMGSHVLAADDYIGLTLPVISLDRQLSDTIPFVCCDNLQGGVLATRHLIERGCKKLLHISGSLDVKMLSNRRTDAFIETCREAGIPHHTYELPDVAVVAFSEEAFVRELLLRHADCDGVFATSDMTASVVIQEARRLGRRVPEDLKVVGFDGTLIADVATPAITTVAQPMDALCRYAVEYLLRMIEGEAVPTQNILPVTLRVQASTEMREPT